MSTSTPDRSEETFSIRIDPQGSVVFEDLSVVVDDVRVVEGSKEVRFSISNIDGASGPASNLYAWYASNENILHVLQRPVGEKGPAIDIRQVSRADFHALRFGGGEEGAPRLRCSLEVPETVKDVRIVNGDTTYRINGLVVDAAPNGGHVEINDPPGGRLEVKSDENVTAYEVNRPTGDMKVEVRGKGVVQMWDADLDTLRLDVPDESRRQTDGIGVYVQGKFANLSGTALDAGTPVVVSGTVGGGTLEVAPNVLSIVGTVDESFEITGSGLYDRIDVPGQELEPVAHTADPTSRSAQRDLATTSPPIAADKADITRESPRSRAPHIPFPG
jgi:hypothetical protein